MPISEDEYDPCSTYEASSTMSKAELRKTHKPIMEKRRRARINHCLNEIKTLILDALKKDPARHSKLEKADILEMAVKHLQNVQRQQLALAMATDPSVLRKFKAGFNECADEVNRYISNLEGLDAGLQQRITTHLSKCISGIEQIVHLNFPGFGGVPFLTNTSNFFSSQALSETPAETPGDQNNNPSIQISQSLQLIPSRLPTGEFALLLPNSSNLPYFSSVTSPNPLNQPNQGSSQEPNKPTRPSAFVTVIPSSLNAVLPSTKSPSKPPTKLLSPPQSPTSSSCGSRQEEDSTGVLNQNIRNSPSPRGFRPVNPSQRILISSGYPHQPGNSSMEAQSLVTSTSTLEKGALSPKGIAIQTELKTMRFPIQKFPSPQKLVEPLSIITNHSERYKHAQILEDTVHYEENIQRGVKRKGEFAQPGLLAVAHPSNKIMKTYHESSVADFRISKSMESTRINVTEVPRNFHQIGTSSDEKGLTGEVIDCSQKLEMRFQESNLQVPSTSRSREGSSETNSDMWRPW